MTEREMMELVDEWEMRQAQDLEFRIREAAYMAANDPRIHGSGLDIAWMPPIDLRVLMDPRAAARPVEFRTIRLRVPRVVGLDLRTRVLLCERIIREALDAKAP